MLEQHARRALAIAAALQVENRDPDRGLVRLLLQAKVVVAAGAIAAVATVTTGALEEVGKEILKEVVDTATDMLQSREEESYDHGKGTDSERLTTHPSSMDPGELLRQHRTNQRITQRHLADVIGVSPSAISNWESGKARPQARMIPRLADALDLDPDEADVLKRALLVDPTGPRPR